MNGSNGVFPASLTETDTTRLHAAHHGVSPSAFGGLSPALPRPRSRTGAPDSIWQNTLAGADSVQYLLQHSCCHKGRRGNMAGRAGKTEPWTNREQGGKIQEVLFQVWRQGEGGSHGMRGDESTQSQNQGDKRAPAVLRMQPLCILNTFLALFLKKKNPLLDSSSRTHKSPSSLCVSLISQLYLVLAQRLPRQMNWQQHLAPLLAPAVSVETGPGQIQWNAVRTPFPSCFILKEQHGYHHFV